MGSLFFARLVAAIAEGGRLAAGQVGLHMRSVLRLAIVLAIAGLVAGCSILCQETRCFSHPSLVVVVTDADTGAPLEAVRVLVQEEAGTTEQVTNIDAGMIDWPAPRNEGHSYETGRLHVTVTADGYLSTSFDVQIDKDICGRPVGQRRDVALQKLGAARQAIVNEGEGPKQCGQ